MPNDGPFYAPGVYLGRITDQALGKSESKGTPQIALRFRVIGKVANNGEKTIEDVPQEYERTAYLYVTEKTAERTVETLRLLGYTRDSFRFVDKSENNFHSFTDQEVEFVCNHEAYEGKTSEKWQVKTPHDSKPLEVKKLESKELRDLDNLYGKAFKKTALVSAPKTAAVGAMGVSDDDLPF